MLTRLYEHCNITLQSEIITSMQSESNNKVNCLFFFFTLFVFFLCRAIHIPINLYDIVYTKWHRYLWYRITMLQTLINQAVCNCSDLVILSLQFTLITPVNRNIETLLEFPRILLRTTQELKTFLFSLTRRVCTILK